jgi:hypothetical protein
VTRSDPDPLVIGAIEYVDFPEWRILRLRAKIDTGARTSALHVEDIRELAPDRVRFDVRLSRNQSDRRVTVEARVVRRGQVRLSNGELETRIFVAVRLRIGPVEREIEVGLVDRGRMIFRMLIGRRALGQAFLIDPSRRYLLTKPTLHQPRPASSTNRQKVSPVADQAHSGGSRCQFKSRG